MFWENDAKHWSNNTFHCTFEFFSKLSGCSCSVHFFNILLSWVNIFDLNKIPIHFKLPTANCAIAQCTTFHSAFEIQKPNAVLAIVNSTQGKSCVRVRQAFAKFGKIFPSLFSFQKDHSFQRGDAWVHHSLGKSLIHFLISLMFVWL